MELGISVATESRQKGYASHLWNYLTAYAQQHNKKSIHIQYLGENRAMASFCAKRKMVPTLYGMDRASVWFNPAYRLTV